MFNKILLLLDLFSI